MNELAKKKCVPCEGGSEPLQYAKAHALLAEVPGWQMAEDVSKISREFTFKHFLDAMEFVHRIADIAEMEDHHPDIHIFHTRVKLDLSTHAVKGLSENDFILAAKINELPMP